MGPGKPSDHYQRFLDIKFGFREDGSRRYDIECHPRHDVSRSNITLKTRLLFEALDQEATGDPSILVKLHERADDGDSPLSYYSNPVVAESDDDILPTQFFMDGLPYSLVDSVVGVSLKNMVSGRFHNTAIVRKRI